MQNKPLTNPLPAAHTPEREKKGKKNLGMLLSVNEKNTGTPKPHLSKLLIDSPDPIINL